MKGACFHQSVIGLRIEICQSDMAQFCFRKYLTLGETLYLSDLRWLCYKLLLWDRPQAPLPSVENHLIQGVVSLRLMCSHDWLTEFPLSLAAFLCLCSAISIFHLYVRIILLLQAFLIFNRFQVQLFFSVQNTQCWRERKLNPLETQNDQIYYLHRVGVWQIFHEHNTFFYLPLFISTNPSVSLKANKNVAAG